MSVAVRESTTTHTSRKLVNHDNLENNLDALLEDLQTSVSRTATPNLARRTVEHRLTKSPTRVEHTRTISPSQSAMTTTEKFVSSGPAGVPSGIPGLEFIDKELQDVQPGQSKTVAYKQVSYRLDKNYDGQPIDVTDSWNTMESNVTMDNVLPVTNDIHEKSYEESKFSLRPRSPYSKSSTLNRETYDVSRQKEVCSNVARQAKYLQESSSYQSEPKYVQNADTSLIEKYENVEYVPVPTPSPTIPVNLAPGPNTKVTTTIKTYTYELPGSPDHYIPGSKVTNTVVLPGEQTITYTPSKYGTSPPVDVTQKSKTILKEKRYYHEDHQISDDLHNLPPRTTYHTGPPGTESKTEIIRNEKYYQVDGSYPTTKESHTTTIDRVEEYYPGRDEPIKRYPTQEPPITSTTYYPSHPHTSSNQSSTTIYKYANTSSSAPPHKEIREPEIIRPQPFPTDDRPRNLNGQGPPKKLEDLMASFSESEREVIHRIEKKDLKSEESRAVKKEVDFVPHTPPKVKSKNVAGPPVYYPPGSAEFTKKEEAGGAMMQSGGQWEKASGKYEYEASSKSKSKSSSGAAVVPVCLPLCCALPCTII